MGGPHCTICDHPARIQIDKLLVRGSHSDRLIAQKFGVSQHSVTRHRRNHLPKYLARSAKARELLERDRVLQVLEGRIEEIEMLLDACHEYLLDPNDPTRYWLGPRAQELEVVYLVPYKGDQKAEYRRENLQHLVNRVLGGDGAQLLTEVHFKHADPRKLLIQAAHQLESVLHTIARISGFMPKEEAGAQTQINMQVIYQVMPNIISALRDYPEAQAAVLSKLEKAMAAPQLEAPPGPERG